MNAKMNQLPPPEAISILPFESQLNHFKETLIGHIAETEPSIAQAVQETLENEAEVLTKLIETCVVLMQSHQREVNRNAAQMFANWANGPFLDMKAAEFGLERQVVQSGDPDVTPPIEPVMESDEQLRERYFLAPYQMSQAGPAQSYRYHALTLGVRPDISVTSPDANTVVITHSFPEKSMAAKIKDAAVMQSGPGEVAITLLANSGNGIPDPTLLNQAQMYFSQEDIGPLTDKVIIREPEIISYQIQAVMYVVKGPDKSILYERAIKKLKAYAAAQHQLGGCIELGMLYHVLHESGAKRVILISPANGLKATHQQALWCDSIQLEVRDDP